MSHFRKARSRLLGALVLAACASLAAAAVARANHPVFVEGNCLNPSPPGSNAVPHPGSCGDYDGDARIGADEDTDGDRVFGTIGAALGAGSDASAGFGVNQNGSVTIVSSGVFPEQVTITAANGNVTLQAAPGVEAAIDAVLQGTPANIPRLEQTGIVVDAPAGRHVVLRNLTVRNWASGITVSGDSRLSIDGVRLENNVNHGILVADRARAAITRSEVHATGFRASITRDYPVLNTPGPGNGIEFRDLSSGTVYSTVVSGSFGAGVADLSSQHFVCLALVNLFDNNPNLEGIVASRYAGSCVQDVAPGSPLLTLAGSAKTKKAGRTSLAGTSKAKRCTEALTGKLAR
jgi:hypothetical protein